MTTYAKDRVWSDQFLPAVCRIVGPRLLIPTPDAMDRTQAADLMVLKARDLTIAVRVRRGTYAANYRHDVTIRSGRPSGVKTELQKIVDGFGDWMLYAFSDPQTAGGLLGWVLFDLALFRAALIRRTLTWTTRRNPDGTEFVVFDVRQFVRQQLVIEYQPVALPQVA